MNTQPDAGAPARPEPEGRALALAETAYRFGAGMSAGAQLDGLTRARLEALATLAAPLPSSGEPEPNEDLVCPRCDAERIILCFDCWQDADIGAPAPSEGREARQWCQPGDDAARRWVLLFEDPDRGLSVFDSEREARAAFEQANASWNCYLLAAAPALATPPVSPEAPPELEELRERVERLRRWARGAKKGHHADKVDWSPLAYILNDAADALEAERAAAYDACASLGWRTPADRANLARERAAREQAERALRGVGYFDAEAPGELCWCSDEDATDEHDEGCLAARRALFGES